MWILGKMFFVLPSSDLPIATIFTGERVVTFAAAAVLSTPILYDLSRRYVAWHTQRPWPDHESMSAYVVGLACGLAVFALAAIKILSGSYSPFIYFRF